MERVADCAEMIEDADVGSSYEIECVMVTAEEWNRMSEFIGW